jgi:sulfinoalanine decarboxylase/sulfinoalanine decarboxylase/aspartate 1-decarboxylase
MKEDINLFNIIADALLKEEIDKPVVDYIPVSKLDQAVDISLSNNPINKEEFEEIVKDLILKTPKTSSRMFFNQLFGGRKSKAVLGDLLAVLLNNSMYTYKVAGPQVGVEKEIINQICNIVGYDAKKSGGTLPSGGSMSNLMAMIMARDAYDLDIRTDGNPGKMIAYTSKESHYSVPKNAALMGIGRNNVRFIETDETGEMIPELLENQIQKDLEYGFVPFFINATAGTTVMGAFDPIESISKICEKFKLWLHIDGAYCGSVIFSEKYKYLIAGVEKADSFSVNAHKMLNTPLTCSIIVAKDKKHLYNSFSNDAEYLYQTGDDDYNLGKTSLQCGRRNDALKLWTLWKFVGTKGLSDIVEKQFYLADVARSYIKENADYQLYSFNNSISICFNYKNISPKKLCTLLYEKAEIMVGFGAFQNEEFVRFVTINSENTKEDILNFFQKLEQFVEGNKESLLVETSEFASS